MILVDQPRDWGSGFNDRWGPSAHLFSDLPGDEGARELAAFAAKIGLAAYRPHHAGEYNEHYDVAGWWFEAALREGAVPVDRYKLVEVIKAKRAFTSRAK